MPKYYITPTLLNSWNYNINNGTLEDFIRVLKKEKFEPSEAILKGFEYEKYMQDNYEETLEGTYQLKVSKDYGDYLLYGIVDCLKGGIIYDYKYTANYVVGKFLTNYQTAMYLELIPEARKMVYLITNKFEERYPVNCNDIITIEGAISNEDIKVEYITGEIFREEYTRETILEPINIIVDKFIAWLKQMDLYSVFEENWKCKY